MNFQKLWTKLFTRNNETEEIGLHVSGATVRHRNPFESLEVPRNEQELPRDFTDKWVVPFYMTSLSNTDDTTILMFADAAKEINVGIVKVLLGDFNWRTRIAGAFFAAINDYKEVEEIIGKHLLKSEVCYWFWILFSIGSFWHRQSKRLPKYVSELLFGQTRFMV